MNILHMTEAQAKALFNESTVTNDMFMDDLDHQDMIDRMTCGYPPVSYGKRPATGPGTPSWDEVPF